VGKDDIRDAILTPNNHQKLYQPRFRKLFRAARDKSPIKKNQGGPKVANFIQTNQTKRVATTNRRRHLPLQVTNFTIPDFDYHLDGCETRTETDQRLIQAAIVLNAAVPTLAATFISLIRKIYSVIYRCFERMHKKIHPSTADPP
jgi:hypothetical protein